MSQSVARVQFTLDANAIQTVLAESMAWLDFLLDPESDYNLILAVEEFYGVTVD